MMTYKAETWHFIKHLKLGVSTVSYLIEGPKIRGRFCSNLSFNITSQVKPLPLRSDKSHVTCLWNNGVTETRLVTYS
jgi:hypothetical protein